MTVFGNMSPNVRCHLRWLLEASGEAARIEPRAIHDMAISHDTHADKLLLYLEWVIEIGPNS